MSLKSFIKNSDHSDRYFFKLNSKEIISEINDTLIENFPNCKFKDLSEIHKIIKENQINEYRLNCFHDINKIPDLKKKIFDAITPQIFPILGMDIAIQKNLNLSIQMPNDKFSILDKHIDYESGDSPFQWVLWIPLTNSFETNSMFMRDSDGSYNPLKLQKGEFLLFDPNTYHGNIVNKTTKTRVSINIRLKNWFAPDIGERVPDRQHGIYYEDFCFTESTLRAFKMVKNTIK